MGARGLRRSATVLERKGSAPLELRDRDPFRVASAAAAYGPVRERGRGGAIVACAGLPDGGIAVIVERTGRDGEAAMRRIADRIAGDAATTRRGALLFGALLAGTAHVRRAAGRERRASVWITGARDPEEALARIFAQLPADLATGKRLALKANFNSADPFPAATAPDTLEALVARLSAMRPRTFALAERSGMGDTRSVLERAGVPKLAARYGLELLVLDRLERAGWVTVRRPDLHWQRGFLLARAFAEAELVVQTCCLKTHRFGGHFTMALKNAVGAVAKVDPTDGYDYMRELHSSPHQRAMIAEISTAFRSDLVVMDARKGFRTGGPEAGTLVEPGLFLASTDPVAIDAVGVALLRRYGTTPEVARGPIFAQDQLARAVELGIGVGSAAAIELVGLDDKGARAAAELRPYLS